MSDMAERPEKACPICGKPTDHAVRPFCSKRCADVDLHRWLGGHYAVPVIEEDGEEGAGNSPSTQDPADGSGRSG